MVVMVNFMLTWWNHEIPKLNIISRYLRECFQMRLALEQVDTEE